MLKRASYSLVPAAVALAVCAVCAAIPYFYLQLNHPDDPTIIDTYWLLVIYAAPIWIFVLPLIGFVAWIIAHLTMRLVAKQATSNRRI
jgi:hypothetical protein